MGRSFPFLIIELFVVIVVVFGAEFLTQALFHAAAPHGQIVPAADQQATNAAKARLAPTIFITIRAVLLMVHSS